MILPLINEKLCFHLDPDKCFQYKSKLDIGLYMIYQQVNLQNSTVAML